MKSKRKYKKKALVSHRLEFLSKEVVKKYYNLITELIGSSHGIYALYNNNKLYYVGKSIDLKRRIKHHLRDRHLSAWNYFSLYLVRREEYIGEIESLLVRISNPKGNRVKPKGKANTQLMNKLKNLIKQKQTEDFEKLFSADIKTSNPKKQKKAGKRILEGLVDKNTIIKKTYKGQEYKAILTKSGKVKYNNKTYNSLSAAATAITNKPANGWAFWRIRNSKSDWIRIKDL